MSEESVDQVRQERWSALADAESANGQAPVVAGDGDAPSEQELLSLRHHALNMLLPLEAAQALNLLLGDGYALEAVRLVRNGQGVEVGPDGKLTWLGH